VLIGIVETAETQVVTAALANIIPRLTALHAADPPRLDNRTIFRPFTWEVIDFSRALELVSLLARDEFEVIHSA
jgi:hypothetical protein